MKIDSSMINGSLPKANSKKLKNDISLEIKEETRIIKNDIRSNNLKDLKKVEFKDFNEAKQGLSGFKDALSERPSYVRELNNEYNIANIQYLLRNEEN